MPYYRSKRIRTDAPTLLPPTSGRILVAGFDMARQGKRAKASLGIMASRHQRQGNLDVAVSSLQIAVRSDPVSTLQRGNLAACLLAAGRYQEAIEQSAR